MLLNWCASPCASVAHVCASNFTSTPRYIVSIRTNKSVEDQSGPNCGDLGVDAGLMWGRWLVRLFVKNKQNWVCCRACFFPLDTTFRMFWARAEWGILVVGYQGQKWPPSGWIPFGSVPLTRLMINTALQQCSDESASSPFQGVFSDVFSSVRWNFWGVQQGTCIIIMEYRRVLPIINNKASEKEIFGISSSFRSYRNSCA